MVRSSDSGDGRRELTFRKGTSTLNILCIFVDVNK